MDVCGGLFAAGYFELATARCTAADKDCVVIFGKECFEAGDAFAKSQLGSGTELPLSGKVFVSVRDGDKAALVEPCRQLVEWGFELVATRGTGTTLGESGLEVTIVNKVREGRPDIVDEMRSGRIQLVFNTTEGTQAIADSFSLRRAALTNNIPYYTTVAGARAAVQAIGALRRGNLEVAPLQSYF